MRLKEWQTSSPNLTVNFSEFNNFFHFSFYCIELNLKEDFPENALSQIKTRWRPESTFKHNPLGKYQLTDKDWEPLMNSLRTRLKSKKDLMSVFFYIWFSFVIDFNTGCKDYFTIRAWSQCLLKHFGKIYANVYVLNKNNKKTNW